MTVGQQILGDSDSDLLQMAATIALAHRERWDGTGCPSGLNGEGIPLEGRIVAVVDVFDALVSDRCNWPAIAAEALFDNLEEAQRLEPVHP